MLLIKAAVVLGLMGGVSGGAIAQSGEILGAEPPAAAPTDGQPPESEAAEPASPALEDSLTCPPGQFPSVFADVLPAHWAYTAVNNLAGGAMQCFDFPTANF